MKVTNRPQMDKAVQIAFPCVYRGESVLGYKYPDATLLAVSVADTSTSCHEVRDLRYSLCDTVG